MYSFYAGRNNLSATIFVPYDCNNNCPFCTSKKDYKNTDNFNIEAIIRSIKIINRFSLVKEFVITGGEPFANIFGLKRIIAACEKPIYINTTLPLSTIDESIELINTEDRIKGVNISRHMGFDFDCVASVEDMDRIEKPVRINTVLNKSCSDKLVPTYNIDEIVKFCYKYGKKNRDINLRADYRSVTYENLHTIDDISYNLLGTFQYIETESCLVCHTDYFSVDNKFIVSYHRGLEDSDIFVQSTDEDEYGVTYVNDIVIKQDGNIYNNWDSLGNPDFLSWLIDNIYEEKCPHGGDTNNDCEDCVYSTDYHFANGECVERDKEC